MNVISLLGVLFAAVAAWGAVTTVLLTRRMYWEAGQRRVMEALVSVKYAAMDLERVHPQPPYNERTLLRFRDAQQELDRAWMAAWGKLPGDDDVLEPLGALLRAFPPDRDTPAAQFDVTTAKQALEMVGAALDAFTSGEFDDPPPMRWALFARIYRPIYGLTHHRELGELQARFARDEGRDLESRIAAASTNAEPESEKRPRQGGDPQT